MVYCVVVSISNLCCSMYCLCQLCCSMYYLCVYVFCTTATGFQPNCSQQIYHIISYHIISYHIISYHIISYHIIKEEVFEEDGLQTHSLIFRWQIPILLRSITASEGVRSRTTQFITNVTSFGPSPHLDNRTHRKNYTNYL